jgi:[acyl-carrier-protein] S-malonyltransferase
MGRDLMTAHAAARAVFEQADDILGYPLSKLCADGPESQLVETHHAQPAILVHSIAVYRCIQDAIGPVSCAAGHSLGEFTAWVVAGTLRFEDGVRLVRRRGELMHATGVERPGTMAALLGLEDEAVERLCVEASQQGQVCVPANYNAPGQTVISGDVIAVDNAIARAKAAGARRAIRLNVSGAFHSPLMKLAEAGLREQLADIELRNPAFPVIANVSAKPVGDGVMARRMIEAQLTSPVRWTESVAAMREAGATTFLELGPGNVLTGLLRRIDREAAGRAIGSADDVATFTRA